MSFQLIPFESVSNLPALNGPGNLGDMLAHASSSYPVLSLKGKKFTRVAGGEKKTFMNPKDPSSHAQYLDVIILATSKIKPRVFYGTAYNPDEAEGRKPDCMSSDGVKPDANAEKPQCATCAACPQNVWGTKKRGDGTMGKGKACDETIRMAVASPGALNDPMLLRVPPGSLKAVPELAKFLKARKINYSFQVVTRVSFDPEADAQKLVFTPTGAVPPDYLPQVVEASQMEVTQKIVDGDGAEFEMADESAFETAPTTDAAPPAPQKRPTAKKVADAAVAKAAAAAAAAPTKEVTLDEVQTVVAAAAPATEARTAQKVVAAADVLEVDDLEIPGLDEVGFDD